MGTKDPSEELLNKDFGERIQDKCKRLRTPDVTLNFPGRRGRLTWRNLLTSCKPNQVLPEGSDPKAAMPGWSLQLPIRSSIAPRRSVAGSTG